MLPVEEGAAELGEWPELSGLVNGQGVTRDYLGRVVTATTLMAAVAAAL